MSRHIATITDCADDERYMLRCWAYGCRVADHVAYKMTLMMAAQFARSHAVHSGHKVDIEEEGT